MAVVRPVHRRGRDGPPDRPRRQAPCTRWRDVGGFAPPADRPGPRPGAARSTCVVTLENAAGRGVDLVPGRVGPQVAKTIGELDWDGQVRWRFGAQAPDGLAQQHHDWARLPNGHTLVLANLRHPAPGFRQAEVLDDVAYEVDGDGAIVWRWVASEHLDELGFTPAQLALIRGADNADVLHINDLKPVGPNHWFDAGDTRFAPDNLIFCSRNANVIAIVDRHSGHVVWTLGPNYPAIARGAAGRHVPRPVDQISGQHDAQIIPAGLPGAGNLLVFDNQGEAGYPAVELPTTGGSRVLEIDPVSRQIVWQYTAEDSGQPAWAFRSTHISAAPTAAQRQRLHQTKGRAAGCSRSRATATSSGNTSMRIRAPSARIAATSNRPRRTTSCIAPSRCRWTLRACRGRPRGQRGDLGAHQVSVSERLHPATHRHHDAAVAGHPAGRHRGVSAAAGGTVAAGRLPDAAGLPASLPGASPRTMASNVAQPLERQFSLVSGLAQMTSVNSSGATQVTLQFDLGSPASTRRRRTCRPPSPPPAASCPPTCPARRRCARSTRPTRPSSSSPRSPRHAAVDGGGRLCREHPRAAELADQRRGPGQRQRPAAARHPGAGRPGAGRGVGHRARGHPRGAGRHVGQPARRAPSTPRRRASRCTPTTSC